MSNSSLVNCTVLSPNHSGKRNHSIDRITPHCVVGQLSAESIGGCFTKSSVQASCNYGIGTDGRVVLCVDEDNRSWCSSSGANDHRAVTIECASDKVEPYTMNNAVYNKLIDLCVDICARNGKKKLLWIADSNKALTYKPKSDEMLITVHRWFANKSCPGDWLFSRLGDLANSVTAKLNPSSAIPSPATPKAEDTLYRVQIGAFKVKENAEKQLKEVKKAGFNDAFITKVGDYYKVQVGAFSVKENADKMLSSVKSKGFDAFITTVSGTPVSATKTPQNTTPKPTLKVGSTIKIKQGAKDLNSNVKFAPFVYNTNYVVIEINKNKVVFGKGKDVTGVVRAEDVTMV